MRNGAAPWVCATPSSPRSHTNNLPREAAMFAFRGISVSRSPFQRCQHPDYRTGMPREEPLPFPRLLPFPPESGRRTGNGYFFASVLSPVLSDRETGVSSFSSGAAPSVGQRGITGGRACLPGAAQGPFSRRESSLRHDLTPQETQGTSCLQKDRLPLQHHPPPKPGASAVMILSPAESCGEPCRCRHGQTLSSCLTSPLPPRKTTRP